MRATFCIGSRRDRIAQPNQRVRYVDAHGVPTGLPLIHRNGRNAAKPVAVRVVK